MLYRPLCWRVIEKAVFEDFTCVVSNSISSTTAVNSTYTLPILATRQPIHRNRLYFSRTAMLPTTSRSLPAPTRSFSREYILLTCLAGHWHEFVCDGRRSVCLVLLTLP